MALVTSRNPRLAPKDPAGEDDYGVELADASIPPGVTAVSATVVVSPSGLTASAATCSGLRSVARFSAGTHGVDYKAKFTITLSDGQKKVRTITIPVREA